AKGAAQEAKGGAQQAKGKLKDAVKGAVDKT
ncbi:CsbD family protein, partial [Sinorhizobium meliloti]|nr:CsbD family protein [Sinorhizobium meliloti]MDW9692601.1 CsbD family protein [Sinorhizobium meliloti]MDW9720749.1 CsbD family protein [Sinorhizobium meliloti]MDW9757974.1 CsbD family protein [Sinorhizobium meliloti]